MAGSITISSIILDSDNNFSIRSNTGATILSANGTGLITGIASGSAITNAQLTTPTVSGQATVNSGASASSVILNSTNAGGAALNIQNSGTVNALLGGYNSIVGSGNATDVMLSATQGVLAFGTGASSTERMRINSSGDVGIGTSSPASLLHITGNDPTIRLTDNGGSPAATWSMRSADGNFAIRDVTNSFDRATFNANGCMALTGANLTATGIGITFPATQSASSDANTLDDYEEGSWTATVSTGGIASQSCRYTKIGRAVTISGAIAYNGASVDPSIAGLPFTSANTYDVAVAVYSNGMEVSSGGPVIAFVLKNSTQLLFYSWVNNSLGSAYQSSGDVSFTCTYFV